MNAVGSVLPARQAGAIFAFTVTSVVRNRRALITMATYLGLGVALAGTRLISASVRGRPLPLDEPFDYLLAIPLLLTFFLVLGARAAFSVPTELGANWIFRLAGPRDAAAHAPATKLACGLRRRGPGLAAGAPRRRMAVGPGRRRSGGDDARRHGASARGAGHGGFAAVPFTRAHALAASSLKVAAPLGVLAVHVYAFRLDDLQRSGARHAGRAVVVCRAMTAASFAAARAGRWWFGRPATAFDAPSDHAAPAPVGSWSVVGGPNGGPRRRWTVFGGGGDAGHRRDGATAALSPGRAGRAAGACAMLFDA